MPAFIVICRFLLTNDDAGQGNFSYLVSMKRQTALFWIAAIITVVWMFLMRPFTPPNIVAFEFARTVANTIQILGQWGLNGMENARISILLDFIFLALYSYTLSMGCKVVVSFVNHPRMKKAGQQFARIIWVAGGCDLIENICLLTVLQKINAWPMELSFWMAGIKFTIITLVATYILAGTFMGLFNRLLKTRHPA